jgi:hypothetical protein
VGQGYQCWWRICQEINVFSRFEYYILHFISICDLFTDSPSYIFFFSLPILLRTHWVTFQVALTFWICMKLFSVPLVQNCKSKTCSSLHIWPVGPQYLLHESQMWLLVLNDL